MLHTFNKINLGASPEELREGWLGISLFEETDDYILLDSNYRIFKHIPTGGYVMCCDLRHPLPFNNNSIDTIFSSHFIEHIELPEFQRLLGEIKRILKPGGWVRLVTPDMGIWVEKLYNKDKEFFEIYRSQVVKHFGPSHWLSKLTNPLQMLNIMLFIWGHRWMWDFETLETELLYLDFKNITHQKFLESNIPNIEEIENILPQSILSSRNAESIYIEASKPHPPPPPVLYKNSTTII